MADHKKIVMPSASFIVARSNPGNVIGCENKLPWRLRTDLRQFRELTLGHVVIMGRKTLESIGKPLPNRTNIVLSRDHQPESKDVIWVQRAEDAIFMADFFSILRGQESFFVIGGGQIYDTFADRDMYSRVYLTEVFCNLTEGDSFFSRRFDMRTWKTVNEIDFPASEHDQYPFRFVTLDKRAKTIRLRLKSDFLTGFTESETWRENLTPVLDAWESKHLINTETQSELHFA